MRICNALAGEVAIVDVSELQFRKPIDLVRQHARDRWEVGPEELIMLTDGGGTFGPSSGSEDLGQERNVFFFPKAALEAEADLVADRLDPHAPGLVESGLGAEDEDDVVGQRCEDVIDPAFEAFRGNIAEARKRIAESKPVAALACRVEERLAVQRLAIRAVLDNLTSHRATCSRSMSLLSQKHRRVQIRLDENVEKVEASMAALEAVALHPVLRAEGRNFLADVIPRDRIARFTASLEAERAQLSQRLEKLQRQDNMLQAAFEQASHKVAQLLEEDSVAVEAKAIRDEQVRAQRELLPELRALVPSAGAAPLSVLEDEKRSAVMLEGLAKTCADIGASLAQLQAAWDRQHQILLQRLREVSCVQSKVRHIERQAALLEEEVNAQSGYSQQLGRLQKMPRAYQRSLQEVARRRQFRSRYLAQADQARISLSRMVEEENSRRRSFMQRHSPYLPADLVQGLGGLAPPATVDVPDFDAQLPEIEFPMAASDKPGMATGREQRASSVSSCSSSLRSPVGASSSNKGPVGANTTPEEEDEKTAEEEEEPPSAAGRASELEARNRVLEEQLAKLRKELSEKK